MSMMHRLSEGKLSTTMKDALIRNNIAEQKMKTALTSLNSVNKKQVHSLENKKLLYEKRREELKRSLAVDHGGADKLTMQRGMPRSLSPRPESSRYDRSRSPNPRPENRYDRSRSPSPRPESGRYDRSQSPNLRPENRYDRSRSPSPRPDLEILCDYRSSSSTPRPELKPRPTSSINRKFSEPTRFTTVTELNSNQLRHSKSDNRPRSISLVSGPSIEISEADDDDSTGVKLPPISSPRGLKPEILLQQRRNSTGGLPIDAGRSPRRSSLTSYPEPLTPNAAVDVMSPRSASSSIVRPRKGIRSPGTQLPRGITRKNMSDEMKDLSGILETLDNVKHKNVPDLDSIDMRSRPSVVEKQNSQEKIPMSRENAQDVVTKENDEGDGEQKKENKMADESLDDLASSMDKLKFCTYLRGNDVNLDSEQNLPAELVPRCLIIGHTKVALHDK